MLSYEDRLQVTCIAAKQRARAWAVIYHLANLEKRHAWAKRWKTNNPKRVSSYMVGWRARNRGKVLRHKRTYWSRNGDRINAGRRTDPIHIIRGRLYAEQRRARRMAVRCDLTSDQWTEIQRQFDGKCAYCGEGGEVVMDHVVALAKGGSHTKDNVVPACRHCNQRKYTKSVEEFLSCGVQR
jgi:5-methylcytosine-specific restriction endonuclease McrA